MSGQTYKTSRAYIRPETINQRYVYALDAINPESVLVAELRTFFESVGYSEMFPNFDKLRVGVVHPFAILLSQEIMGVDKSVDLFPSITVIDSSSNEESSTLSNEMAELVFTKQDIATLDGYRQAKEIHISDTGWQKILDVVNLNGSIVGVQKIYTTRCTIDFNIWSENKDITSFLYDMVGHFIIQNQVDIHNKYDIDLSGGISGRRTGDINLDFGMLLHGASVQVGAVMEHTAVKFDVSPGVIGNIDTKVLPRYY